MNPKNATAIYLVCQALGTAAWWGLLWTTPGSIVWFQPEQWPKSTLLSFWLPDLVILVTGSLVAAYAIGSEKHWGQPVIWMLAAAVWYPTLYCISVSLQTDQAWIASAMMTVMAAITLSLATIQGFGDQVPATIRVNDLQRRSAIGWTLIQTALFWGVFLWVIPKGIAELESRMSMPILDWFAAPLGGIALFGLGSTVGLWSGLTMAALGRGTPLPTATASQLVVAGPYRFVRNPMAIAGIMQGIAVGLYLGSYCVLIYSVSGIFVWHLLVRPVEESDLLRRFGSQYQQYRTSVGLWIPRVTPFRLERK